ncbi:MAG: restriction endonuclease [Candidatus Desulfofervidus auxilii]|nr:restriction endonuclease [Candidatus Desulfofervidus auxilii]
MFIYKFLIVVISKNNGKMYSQKEEAYLLNATKKFLQFIKTHPIKNLSLDKAKQIVSILQEIITYHDWRYYILNDPVISDYEYDKLSHYLRNLEEKFPKLTTSYVLYKYKLKANFSLDDFLKRLEIYDLFTLVFSLPGCMLVALLLLGVAALLLSIFGFDLKMSDKDLFTVLIVIGLCLSIYIIWDEKKKTWKQEIEGKEWEINEKASYPFLKKKLQVLRKKFDEIQKRIYHKTAVLQNIEQALIKKRIHPDYLESLRGVEFENCLYDCFKTLGYFVEKTPSSGDYGVDLVLKHGDKKIAVQVKGTADPVGIKAVQEVYSGKDFYDCEEAWVITNSYFTDSAIKLAKKLNVGLINKQRLLKFLPDADLIEEKKELIKELEELNARKKEIEWEISEISEKLEYIKTKYDFE